MRRTALQAVGTLKMNGAVRCATFSADGNQLYSSGSDGVLYLWDLRTQVGARRSGGEGPPRINEAIAFFNFTTGSTTARMGRSWNLMGRSGKRRSLSTSRRVREHPGGGRRSEWPHVHIHVLCSVWQSMAGAVRCAPGLQLPAGIEQQDRPAMQSKYARA